MTFSNKRTKIHATKKERIIPIVQRTSQAKPVLVQRTIDYKNIVLLRKFITVEGKILPRRISGLTAKQQRNIAKAIKNARMIGLLPFIKKSQPSL
jgi:small subunit ribosomal protein S18